MGFNIFLYGFIVLALLVAKSYDHKPTEPNDNN